LPGRRGWASLDCGRRAEAQPHWYLLDLTGEESPMKSRFTAWMKVTLIAVVVLPTPPF